MPKSKLTIDIASNVSDAAQGINQIAGKLDTLDKKADLAGATFKQVSTKIAAFTAAAGAAYVAVSKLVSAAKETIEVYRVQMEAETKLNAVLSATKNAAGMTAAEVKSFASELQELTTIGDEASIAAMNLYLSTKKLGEEIIPRATMAAADLSIALGEDLTSAAAKLAKVLSSPATELESLKESNIFLTKAQKEQIIELTEQNQLFEAQSLILEAVESAYGGVAKAIADTDIGKLDQISNIWGDIKESLGGALLDSISPALDLLYKDLKAINDKVTEMRQQHGLSDAVLTGGDLSSYSSEELNTRLNNAQAVLRTMTTTSMGYDAMKRTVETLTDELNRRRDEAKNQALNAMGASMLAENARIAEGAAAIASGKGGASPVAFGSNGDLYSIPSTDGYGSAFKQVKAELDEIDKLTAEAEKKALDAREKAEELAKQGAHEIFDTFANLTSSIFDLLQGVYDKQINQLEAQLAKMDEDYAAHFDKISGEYTEQGKDLDKYYALGLLEEEEYMAAQEALQEEETAAKEKAAEDRERIQKEADTLKEKAFNAEKANAIMEATIAQASAIANVWAQHAGNPVIAGTLTGLSMAMLATQIGTIAAQEYTPLATGGITQGPTHALIGEAGPEAIIPLTDSNLERTGLGTNGTGAIYITVNVENSYTGDDLADNVYHSIRKAQRLGMLPAWEVR